MDITRDDVLRCAKLAALSLQEDEVEPMRQAMAQMLSHAQSLDNLALEDVEPTIHGQERPLSRREDVPRDCFTQAEALANAPEADLGHFRVPKVL